MVFNSKYKIHNYSLSLQFIMPTEKRLDENGNPIKIWTPTKSVLDRKVKDVVSHPDVEKKLKDIFSNFVWSGTNLYSMAYIDTSESKITAEVQLTPSERYRLYAVHSNQFDLEGVESENMTRNPFQVTFINLLIQKLMKSTDLLQVGRQPRFFREKERVLINDESLGKIELWPGYRASSYIYNSGIYVVLESINKFLRRENCLDKIKEIQQNPKTNNTESLDRFFKDKLVMTEWGARKVYKITRVRTDMNPLKAFFQAEGEQVSVKDYFFQKYG